MTGTARLLDAVSRRRFQRPALPEILLHMQLAHNAGGDGGARATQIFRGARGITQAPPCARNRTELIRQSMH